MASTLGKTITFSDGGLVVHLQTEDEVREAVRAGTLVGSTKVRIHGDDGEEASGRASAIALLAPFFGDEDEDLPMPAIGTAAAPQTASPQSALKRRVVVMNDAAVSAASQITQRSDQKPVPAMIATKADFSTSPSSVSALGNPPGEGGGGKAAGWGCGLLILATILTVAGASSLTPWVAWPGVILLVIAGLANLGNNGKK